MCVCARARVRVCMCMYVLCRALYALNRALYELNRAWQAHRPREASAAGNLLNTNIKKYKIKHK